MWHSSDAGKKYWNFSKVFLMQFDMCAGKIHFYSNCFSVVSLALSFSNEPDPFFDADLIAQGSATVKIEFIQEEVTSEEFAVSYAKYNDI